MVKVHGLMVAGPRSLPVLCEIVGSRVRRPAPSILGSLSNVVDNQASYLARPTTKAPETQIYCINHRSGAFLVLRLRTVARGERASRSIVNRTTALWSMWIVELLILAGSGYLVIFLQTQGASSPNREELSGHLRHLADRPSGLDGLYH